MTSLKRNRILVRSIATLLAFDVAAQASLWDGGGANALWSTPANWDGDFAPESPSFLEFDGTVGLNSTNDLIGFMAEGISFLPTAGAFTLSGEAITLGGSVTNETALEQKLNFNGIHLIGGINVNTGAGTINFAAPLTADAGATFTKTGAGTLKFTNSGFVKIADGAFKQSEGSLIFDGGEGAIYETDEAWFGTTDHKNVTTTVNSGALSIHSWLALGRGNGAGEVSSDLVLNGSASVTAQYFSAGYNVDNAANKPKGSVTLNGTSSFNITNNDDRFILAESAGSDFTIRLNDSSTLLHAGGITRIGGNGRGLLNIASAQAVAEVNWALLGSGGGGAGAIWNRGTLNVKGGASTENFALGNAVGAYGYYLHDTTSPLLLQEVGIGGSGGGSGVMEIRSGVVTSQDWLTINRSNDANAVASMLLLSGGTLNVPDKNDHFYVAHNGDADQQYAVIDIGAGSKLQGGANSNINLMRGGRAGNTTTLTVHNGGTVSANRIFAGQADGTAVVNFDGGTLVATASNDSFLGHNIDGVFIHAGGMTVDTKEFNSTITAPLQGATGTVLATIPVVDGGAGYIGRPVVKITGGGGTGATAVANFDEATGKVTSITITSPGSGYNFLPTITLVGGGATTPATLGTPTVQTATNTGAFTKNGAGTLTLTAPSTYGGGTTINGGTLRLTNASGSGTGSGSVTINAGATLTGTGGTTGALQVKTGGTLAGSGTHAGAVTVASGAKLSPGEGVGKLTVGGLTLNAGSVLDFEITDSSILDQIVVTGQNGLTIDGGGFHFYIAGGTTSFSANGVYNLIGYSGVINGLGTSALSVLNSAPGKNYVFGEHDGFVTLTIATIGATPNFWNVDANGNWSSGTNWTLGTAPNAPAAVANFGGGGATLTAARTVTVDAPQTVGSIGFNSAASYTIAGSSQITLNNGMAPSSEITVTQGSHTITAPLNAVSGETQITVAGGANMLTISGPLSGATDVAKYGAGTLVLNGANTYTGTTTIAAGTLEINGEGAVGSSLIAKSGSTLRIRGADVSISKPLSFELAGASAINIGAGVNAPSNFTLDVPTGSSVNIASEIAVASGSMVKSGGGTLTLTNPDGNNVLSNTGGTGFLVREGALVLDGGFSSYYKVERGELAIGDPSGHSASLTLESGALEVATYTAVGWRNGTTGANSQLIVNGGFLKTGELFAGYSGDIPGYNAKPSIEVRNDGQVEVTNQLRLGESPGAVSTMSISDYGNVTVKGRLEIGFGGRGILNISDSAFVSVAVLDVGFGSNVAGNTGLGILNQTGGAVIQAGDGGGDWRIGGAMNNGVSQNDSLVYGSYTISGSNSSLETGGRNFQIGAGGRGVLDISDGATVQAGAFPAVGRHVGGVGLLNISGGSFTQTGVDNRLMIGEEGFGIVNISGDGALIARGNPGPAGNGGGTGGIRVGHTATGSGILNLNGGVIQTTGIAKSNSAGKSFVYLNGGELVAGASNATFMQGLDHVVAGPNHAVINTNGFDITIGQAIKSATGQGLMTIPVVNGGSGYLGQPIVSITGDGFGASAVANLKADGTLESITITNPGIGYTTAPTISLLGGGATTEAILGAPIIAANSGTGGLVKEGENILRLSGANTYTGPTIIKEGTLVLTGSISGSSSIEVREGTRFDVQAAAGGFQLGANQTLRGSGRVDGPATISGTVSPGDTVGTLTFNDVLTFNSGSTIALEIASATQFDSLVAPVITLGSQVNLSLSLTYAPLPNTSWLVLSNTGFGSIAQNLFWAGPEGQLSEGEHFFVNGYELMISYTGGTGNDVVLTAVPEPSSLVMLLGGLGSLAGLRRFRRRQG